MERTSVDQPFPSLRRPSSQMTSMQKINLLQVAFIYVEAPQNVLEVIHSSLLTLCLLALVSGHCIGRGLSEENQKYSL